MRGSGPVVTLLCGSILLVAAYFLLGVDPALLSKQPGTIGLVAGLLAAPYACILALIATGRRALGLALAGGTALVALAPLGLFAGVSTLFSGFATHDWELRGIGVLIVAVLSQLALLGLAVRAARALPDDEKRPGSVNVGLAVPLAYALGLAAAGRFALMQSTDRQKNDWRASEALRAIGDCAAAFAAAHPERGFPPDLAALGPEGARCLDAALAAGETPGHRIEFVAAPAGADGRIGYWFACALPVAFPRAGASTYVRDATGATGVAYPLVEDATEPISCPAAWGETPRRVAACLLRHAARNPSEGYPRSIDPLLRDGCLPAGAAEPLGGGGFLLGLGPGSYRPAPPAAGGRVVGFELHGRADEGAWMLDETGTLHLAEGREATREDPTRERLDELACEAGGDAMTCRSIAVRFSEGAGVPRDAARGLALYARACDAGDAVSCTGAAGLLLRGSAVPMDRPRLLALLGRACELGDRDGCATLSDQKRAAAAPGR